MSVQTVYNNNNNEEEVRLSSILDSFSFAIGKLDLASEAARSLTEFHLNRSPVDKTVYIAQLSSIATALTEFAFAQKSFSALNRDDQGPMLKTIFL